MLPPSYTSSPQAQKQQNQLIMDYNPQRSEPIIKLFLYKKEFIISGICYNDEKLINTTSKQCVRTVE
jgi:hypothetical protein